MGKIKVLLCDDQVLFIESLRIVLETRAEDISVVGVAADGSAAIELAETTRPDVVLMDVRMPGMNGVESTKTLKERHPEMRVLMLTTFDDDEYVIEALRLGAAGYLLKDVPPTELIAAVRAVYAGGVLISPRVASRLVDKLVQSPVEEALGVDPRPEAPWLSRLSEREKEILSLLAKGCENREIARRLYIAEQTVKNYVSDIYCKIGVRDRVQAARLAAEAGLV